MILKRSKWHRQDAEQYVRQGQIRDEYIGHSLHGPIPQNYVANQDISEDTQDKDRGVQDVEEDLHELVVNDPAAPILIRCSHIRQDSASSSRRR